MPKSSIHFEKTDASFAQKHNSRKEEPTYLLEKQYWQGNDFEEKITTAELKNLYAQQCQIRRERHARGATPTLKNSQTEAVINLTSKHTLDDVKKVADEIEKRYGLTPVSFALHRDEGHMESRDGKEYPVYNYHAHVVFFTMKDGIAMKRRLTKSDLEDINTLTAQMLGMERGESRTQRWQRVADSLGVEVEELKRHKDETPQQYIDRCAQIAKTKGIENFNIYDETKPRKRLSAKEFRQVAKEKADLFQKIEVKKAEIEQLQNENQKLKSRLLTKKEQTGFLSLIRKNWIKDGTHSQEEYKQLSALKQKTYTQEELDKAIAELNAQHEQRMTELQESSIRSFATLQEQFQDAKNKLTSEIEDKSEENEELQKQNQSLSLKIEKLEKQLAEKPKEVVKTETVDRELNQSEIEKIVLSADDDLIEQHRHFKNTQERLKSDANVLTVESLRAQHKDDVAEIDKLRDANRKLVLSRKSSYTQRLEIIKSATEEELKEHNPVYQRLQTRLNNLIKTAKTGFMKILKVFGLSAADETYLKYSADMSYVADEAVKKVEKYVSDTEELHAEQSQHRSFHM